MGKFSHFLGEFIKVPSPYFDYTDIVFVQCIFGRNRRDKTAWPSTDDCSSHFEKFVKSSGNTEFPFSVVALNKVDKIVRNYSSFSLAFCNWYLYVLTILILLFQVCILSQLLMVYHLDLLQRLYDRKAFGNFFFSVRLCDPLLLIF